MDTKLIPEFIKRAITSEVEIAVKEELELAQKRIEERKAKIVASVMVNLYKQLNIDRIGDTVVLSVKIENN